MGKLERVEMTPELAAKFAAAFEGDPWAGADLMLELWPTEEWSKGDSNTGLHNSIENARQQLYEKYGFGLTTATLRNARATAEAWPRARRRARARYEVHKMLRGADREAQMDKYLYLMEKEGRTVLTDRMVARFRDDEKPRHVVPMREQFIKAVEAASKRVLMAGVIPTTDFWGDSPRLTEPQRSMAVTELRALADRLEQKNGR